VNAALLARSSGADAIGVNELMAVTADDFIPVKPEKPSVNVGLIPIPKYDVALSPTAAAAIVAAGGVDGLSIEQLRSALLEARKE
jgi:hypothetical protein